jgi:hypothetical protein
VPDGETRTEHVAWFDGRAGGTYLPTPVIYKNGLYVLNNTGIFARYNPETGARTYQARVGPATFTASLWAYNGHVFATSEEGDTFVIEAGDQFRVVRVNSLDDFSMASPAIVGDRLIIRTQHRLYSIRQRR